MKTIRIYFLLACLCSVLSAQTKVGTTAANFTQIGLGSRGVAMGESAVALGMDASALYWNPALIATLDRNQAYFNNISWIADISINYGALLINFGNQGVAAVSIAVLNSGEMQVNTEERPEGTGELFTVQEMQIGLTYARQLTERFNLGGTVKFLHSSIWNMSASTMAVDLGLTYRTPFQPLAIGLSISNFGGEMQMRGSDLTVRFDPDPRVDGNNDGVIAYQMTRSWRLPVTFRFGMVYDVLKSDMNQILLSTDVLYPNNNDNYVNAGLEYGFKNTFFLRAGYRQLFLNDSEGGLSFGAGLKMYNLIIDYAFSDRGVLNNVQYFSLGLNF